MARKSSALLKDNSNAHSEFFDPPSEKIQRIKPVNNSLRIRLDDLKTFDPLTPNQKLFFDAYKRGDYFIALHGVAGTGKTFCALYKAIEEVLDKQNSFNKINI